MLRRILIAVILVLLVSGLAGAWIWWHAQPRPIGEAYVGAGDVPLWDGNGQVRRRLAKLAYGEKVAILDHYRDSVEVRTGKGIVGWVDEDGLIEPDVWQRLGQFATRVQTMKVQAQGHTRVLSNLRLEPGRSSPRIGQLRKDTPVEILLRGVAEWAGEGNAGGPRKEDWLLVRARTTVHGEIAGWLLGRFVSDDPPDPLPAYATSAGMQPVAWFPLRNVDDPSGPKPNYLMVGSSGPEGQPCDFTKVRVLTWSVVHERYETAFVRNDLCGKLPVSVTLEPNPQQDVLIRFENLEPEGKQTVTYRMRSTMVRQLRAPTARSRPGRR
jgi:hypothetical protein